ncbi:unnamed protein product [Dibothriocephalus latus]|uniref:Uncharacterized protein n=1 Tax=Dibothriocephalus latus TaxID=60516 RepID=A0A3P7LCQ7_DIBLA|nr:unnamed protein product [Dibothriocephalus latus]
MERYEKYARFALGKWSKNVTSFPLPPKKTMYKTYHPSSTKAKAEFELSKYCRIVRNLPEGIEMVLQENDPQLEESRYVANLEMETLQSELEKLTK